MATDSQQEAKGGDQLSMKMDTDSQCTVLKLDLALSAGAATGIDAPRLMMKFGCLLLVAAALGVAASILKDAGWSFEEAVSSGFRESEQSVKGMAALILAVSGVCGFCYRFRIRVDRRRGTLTIERGVWLFCRTWRYPIDSLKTALVVTSGCVNAVALETKEDGRRILIAGVLDEVTALDLARQLGNALGIDVEHAIRQGADTGLLAARSAYRSAVVRAGVFVVALLLLNAAVTFPLIPSLIHAERYAEGQLQTVPCEILSMRAHYFGWPLVREKPVTQPVRVERRKNITVRFRYIFEGNLYESRKYAPLGNTAFRDALLYPPGHQTECYVNPEWPDQAVLATRSNLQPVKVCGFLSVLLIFCVVLTARAAVRARKRYLDIQQYVAGVS